MSCSDRSGFTILAHCARHHPAIRVLLLTGFDDPSNAIAAMEQGAHGCIGKQSDPALLRTAVRTVLGGGEWWGHLLDTPTLTPRQLTTIGLVARGFRQRDVAEQMGIAEVTVESHLEQVRRRLGAENTGEAIYLAGRLGILEADAWPMQARITGGRQAGRDAPPPGRRGSGR